MELALQRYGSYEKFEAATGGNLLTKSRIWHNVKKYMEKEGCLGEVRGHREARAGDEGEDLIVAVYVFSQLQIQFRQSPTAAHITPSQPSDELQKGPLLH